MLGCSDSRVPAEIVFDQGLGDLFVVRSAGPVLDSAVVGSLETGRRGAGRAPPAGPRPRALSRRRAAVAARKALFHAPGLVAYVTQAIAPAVEEAAQRPGDLLENTLRAHAARVVELPAPDAARAGPGGGGGAPARRRGPLRPGQRAGGGHRPLISPFEGQGGRRAGLPEPRRPRTWHGYDVLHGDCAALRHRLLHFSGPQPGPGRGQVAGELLLLGRQEGLPRPPAEGDGGADQAQRQRRLPGGAEPRQFLPG